MIDIHLSQSGDRVSEREAGSHLDLACRDRHGMRRGGLARPRARPVRTVIVEHRAEGETVSLTGQVRAKDQADLAFRLDGRMIERPVNVGDVVTAGQVVARLDPQNQQNMLRSAQANLSSAEAVLTQARLTFWRQQQLLKDGWTPRAKFDEAAAGFADRRRPRSTPLRHSCASRRIS